MDTMSFRILDIVMSMVTEGEFTVIDKSDIIAKVNDSIGVEELDNIMEQLELHDMIVIKYNDDAVYGIAPRPKGKLAYEKNKFLIKKIENSKEILSSEINSSNGLFGALEDPSERALAVQTDIVNYTKLAIICGASSFIGGIIASIITFILMRLF